MLAWAFGVFLASGSVWTLKTYSLNSGWHIHYYSTYTHAQLCTCGQLHTQHTANCTHNTGLAKKTVSMCEITVLYFLKIYGVV